MSDYVDPQQVDHLLSSLELEEKEDERPRQQQRRLALLQEEEYIFWLNNSETDDSTADELIENFIAFCYDDVFEDDAESSKEEGPPRKKHGGSVPGKAPNKNRDFVDAHNTLVMNYFSGERSRYDEADFVNRFGMDRDMFWEIYDRLRNQDPFQQKYDALKKPGISPLVRLVGCLRMLRYGLPADILDENIQISRSVLMDSVKQFCRLIKKEFGAQYLNRCPTPEEKQQMLLSMANRGYPGAFASWDCKHLVWGLCPQEEQGQHKGKEGKCTMILEAIADADTYIWYHFFGEPGSLNDLNVLDKSSIVGSIISGKFDIKVDPYIINGTVRDWLYFLVDGIYPKWAIFVATVQVPKDEKEAYFAAFQESLRKDIERAFGILVKRFGILKQPLRWWYHEDIKDLVDCCIILHNMLVEKNRSKYANSSRLSRVPAHRLQFLQSLLNPQLDDTEPVTIFPHSSTREDLTEEEVNQMFAARVAHLDQSITDRDKAANLRHDLIAHIWNNHRKKT